MKHSLRIVVVFALLVVFSLTFAPSALLRLGGLTCACYHPDFAFLNPFRSREGERAAEKFLARLRDASCEKVVTDTDLSQQVRNAVCEIQQEHPLLSWNLWDRHDQELSQELLYKIQYEGGESSAWVTVTIEKNTNDWRITGWGSVY